jgi:hypothetical protein
MIVVSIIDSQQVTDVRTIPSLLRVQVRPHYFLTAAIHAGLTLTAAR